jgi:hypothetical protein
MRVGIIEIMEAGHISLAESLAEIFCCDQANHVSIFTLKNHSDNLRFLCNKLPNLTIKEKHETQSKEEFLKEIGSDEFDRLYIVTMTGLFPAFSRWKLRSRLYLVIHNLDEWFSISPVNNTGKFIEGIIKNPGLKLVLYLFKLQFIYPFYRKKILKVVGRSNGSLVVLSESVYREALNLKVKLPLEVVPFSVFNRPSEIKEHDSKKPLRICVPGILSQYRRNYLGLLDIAERELAPYKDSFILDLLGGVQPDNILNDSGPILARTEELNRAGFNIIVHNVRFIPPEEYDRELSLCDIILGNMNVVLTKYSQYGKTKETGITFAMIKSGKPGIIPDAYPVPDELESGTLFYHTSEDLGAILSELIMNRELITELQNKALQNSELFSPDMVYRRLIAKDNII